MTTTSTMLNWLILHPQALESHIAPVPIQFPDCGLGNGGGWLDFLGLCIPVGDSEGPSSAPATTAIWEVKQWKEDLSLCKYDFPMK